MTLKRVALIFATVLVAARLLFSLLGSLQEPQVQNRIALYQTDLVLSATAWTPPATWQLTVEQLLGRDPYQAAAKQYQAAAKETTTNLERFAEQIKTAVLVDSAVAAGQIERAVAQETANQQQLWLKLGIIEAVSGNVEDAIATWQHIPAHSKLATTAGILQALWRDRLPSAEVETLIAANLSGWFRTQTLTQLYTLQHEQTALKNLAIAQQAAAEIAIVKLGLISILPAAGGLLGSGILVVLLGQFIIKRQNSLLGATLAPWSSPWDWETTGLVIIGGFFFFSQIFLATVLPIATQLLGLNVAQFPLRAKALYILVTYCLMAVGGITVLIYAIKPFRPLPPDWFPIKIWGRWPLWGIGGYWIAIPLVLLASLVNQNLWQGQGGGNPIILLALEAHDPVALLIFWSTAAIAAPVFEEVMFRGFLLPSLTRYLPVWSAIGVTSVVFAVAHLSLAEAMPLTILGLILGFVYTRSRNLLATILLHSLWNTGTLFSLFVLGS